METLIQLLQNNPYFGVVTAVIALASAIAAVTPTPKEGSVLAKVYKVIDFLALNVGKAKETGKIKLPEVVKLAPAPTSTSTTTQKPEPNIP